MIKDRRLRGMRLHRGLRLCFRAAGWSITMIIGTVLSLHAQDSSLPTIARLHYEGGGDWYSVIKDGACSIDSGSHDKPACTIKMAAADFLAMMGGKLPAMQAFTSGKLQIEGDVMKSQLLEKLFKIG